MLRFSIGEDSGFSLIEVLVSAFLVLTVAGGTLAGLGTFSKASGSERQRTQAGALIQQAQEDLRTLSPSTLAGYVASPPPDTTATYNGVTYTTHTTAAWVNESSSAAACTGSSTGNRYVRVTTTVSWPGPGGTTRSQTNRTLASVPTSGGRLIVQVFNENKDPQPNVRVDISGPATDNAMTGAGGCAEWDYLAAGTYTVTLSTGTGDYIDKDGNTTPSQTATVVSGKLNIVSFDYARGGQISARFWEGNDTNGTPTVGEFDQITVSNNQMPSGSQTYGTAGTLASTITTGPLYPFTTPYTVVAGTCETPDGTLKNPLYTATVLPGQTVSPSETSSAKPDANGIRLMGYTLTSVSVKRNPGGTNTEAGVKVIALRDGNINGCPAGPQKREATRLTDLSGHISFGSGTWGSALPTGRYDICAEATANGNTYHTTKIDQDIKDWKRPGAFALTVDTTVATPSGPC